MKSRLCKEVGRIDVEAVKVKGRGGGCVRGREGLMWIWRLYEGKDGGLG